jgi:hypothetical protein
VDHQFGDLAASTTIGSGVPLQTEAMYEDAFSEDVD